MRRRWQLEDDVARAEGGRAVFGNAARALKLWVAPSNIERTGSMHGPPVISFIH